MKFNPFIDIEYQPRHVCSVAVAIIGAAGVGAAATAYAAHTASGAQRDATERAAATSMGMYERTRGDLSPFREAGVRAQTDLESRMPFLTSPINLSPEWLESTPGYQFTERRGLKAVQNSAAHRGLGVSGAAYRGAAEFATGLADATYKTQFDVENTNRTNTFNRLMALIQSGQSAAAGTGAAGTQAATTAGNAIIGGGNATAAGINAMGNAGARFAGDVGGYSMWRGLYGAPQTGGINPGVANGGYVGAGGTIYDGPGSYQ